MSLYTTNKCVITNAADAPPQQLVEAFAAHLKKQGNHSNPVWTTFAKTAHFKHGSPTSDDWVFMRAASIARQLMFTKNQTLGVSRLRRIYGGKNTNSTRPGRRCNSSRACIVRALTILETCGFVEKDGEGRKLTSNGQLTLNSLARSLRARKSVLYGANPKSTV